MSELTDTQRRKLKERAKGDDDAALVLQAFFETEDSGE